MNTINLMMQSVYVLCFCEDFDDGVHPLPDTDSESGFIPLTESIDNTVRKVHHHRADQYPTQKQHLGEGDFSTVRKNQISSSTIGASNTSDYEPSVQSNFHVSELQQHHQKEVIAMSQQHQQSVLVNDEFHTTAQPHHPLPQANTNSVNMSGLSQTHSVNTTTPHRDALPQGFVDVLSVPGLVQTLPEDMLQQLLLYRRQKKTVIVNSSGHMAIYPSGVEEECQTSTVTNPAPLGMVTGLTNGVGGAGDSHNIMPNNTRASGSGNNQLHQHNRWPEQTSNSTSHAQNEYHRPESLGGNTKAGRNHQNDHGTTTSHYHQPIESKVSEKEPDDSGEDDDDNEGIVESEDDCHQSVIAANSLSMHQTSYQETSHHNASSHHDEGSEFEGLDDDDENDYDGDNHEEVQEEDKQVQCVVRFMITSKA